MRAFVEVDTRVGLKGLRMGERVRELWRGRCEVQVVAFAQERVFEEGEGEDEGDDQGKGEGEGEEDKAEEGTAEETPKETNKSLLESAARIPSIPVLGSTPYVEASPALARRNIDWIIALAITHHKHLDLHLDYTLDASADPQVFHVLAQLTHHNWTAANPGKTICLGHCTRMTLFSPADWQRLKSAIGHLPVSFVGLPTSDMFMMARPGADDGGRDRKRGTLQVPWMIAHGLRACLGVNNVGNAFTPFGGADPLGVASWGVGVYQVGTARGARVLYEAVSGRGREACGMGGESERERRGRGGGGRAEGDEGEKEKGDGEGGGRKRGEEGRGWGIKVGDLADVVIFGKPLEQRTSLYRPRRSVQEIVGDAGRERVVVKAGRVVRVE